MWQKRYSKWCPLSGLLWQWRTCNLPAVWYFVVPWEQALIVSLSPVLSSLCLANSTRPCEAALATATPPGTLETPLLSISGTLTTSHSTLLHSAASQKPGISWCVCLFVCCNFEWASLPPVLIPWWIPNKTEGTLYSNGSVQHSSAPLSSETC